jgi:hypothetical protein
MRRFSYEVHVERDANGTVLIKQPDGMGHDESVILLSPDQIDQLCRWLREAKESE